MPFPGYSSTRNNNDPSYYPSPRGVGPSTSLFGNPSSFTGAANTQAGDYDTIMKGYRDFLQKNQNDPISATNVTPQVTAPTTAPYAQSKDVTGSLANLSDLATTGGYSAGDIQNIRERDVSPIRSIYANAQQNVERQRALGGGYSPNFNAATEQMSRDESDQIADKTTAANARIAEMQARGRLAGSTAYAGASSEAARQKEAADLANANIVNQINESNANRGLEAGTGNANRQFQAQLYGRNQTMSGLEGMRTLYGTTPALTHEFGNQVTAASGIDQGQQGLEEQRRRDIFGYARQP